MSIAWEKYTSTSFADLVALLPLLTGNMPLSGFLAGEERGGTLVRMLEEDWAAAMGVRHAIACNSATSGLMAAAFAVGLDDESTFYVSPLTMSATAAAPMFTGAKPLFTDILPASLVLDPVGVEGHRLRTLEGRRAKAVFTTALFGNSCCEYDMRAICHRHGMKLVVDAAQAPFAKAGEKFVGTIGDIGVFSLNVHKHLQCGEGGVIVTNDDDLARKMRLFINHGETVGASVGLNLRMTELAALVAHGQLKRRDALIGGRITQAQKIIDAFGYVRPCVWEGTQHVFYVIPWMMEWEKRESFIVACAAGGVPLKAGYHPLLYHMPAFAPYRLSCPEAVRAQAGLVLFENCAWTLTDHQIAEMGRIMREALKQCRFALVSTGQA